MAYHLPDGFNLLGGKGLSRDVGEKRSVELGLGLVSPSFHRFARGLRQTLRSRDALDREHIGIIGTKLSHRIEDGAVVGERDEKEVVGPGIFRRPVYQGG